MKNSVIYLTRRCPRDCAYCAIKNKIKEPELTPDQWIEVFQILKKLKVEFNLVLGNEPWLYRNEIPRMFNTSKIPYALYTTCVEPLFSTYRDLYFGSGNIDNLSAGIDFPILENPPYNDDSYRKSVDVWNGFKWLKKHYPDVDTHATVTIHKLNYKYLPTIVKQLTELGVFININFLHWNKDGAYDFFPSRKEMVDIIFEEDDYKGLQRVLNIVLMKPGLVQNPQMLEMKSKTLVNMDWHCAGDPYEGPTIDADGSLRVCGYRKGTRTPKFSIFDLPRKEKEWKEAVRLDAMDCPGCTWSCPWMFHYWKKKNPELGAKVFTEHAGEHIDKKNWSKRK